jgi:hypothetical protein
LPWSSAICVFFAALYLLQEGGSELFSSDGGGNHLHLLLEGALGNKQLASSDFTLRKKLNVAGLKYGNNQLGEHLDSFHCQLLKTVVGMAARPTTWQKKILYKHSWPFQPNTTLNLF